MTDFKDMAEDSGAPCQPLSEGLRHAIWKDRYKPQFKAMEYIEQNNTFDCGRHFVSWSFWRKPESSGFASGSSE